MPDTGSESLSARCAPSCGAVDSPARRFVAEPKAFGRYEADRPNERWITDVLVGPWVPHPKTPDSVRAKLFLIVDDHSRLVVHGRFFAHENARACW
jgi:putative transposase